LTYFPNPRSTHRDGHEFLIPRTHFNFNRQWLGCGTMQLGKDGH
jgi:hypothetical protein